ncbi:IS66 family insertion sequence element accessory protein TnpA [Leptospira santarosai]|uniref:IS66 family insertion sequence element accessory protein TnpA n=1 Tax=Leptospira santarosai TaxID=28183 RepID=UPI0009E5484A|nr:hypothetical protein [Leptospira santarosai]
MKKTNIDWPKEFNDFSKSGLSQPRYCKERHLKYTTFRYHWERRSKNSEKSDLEPVSKLVVLLNRNYLLVKWTNIIQRYRMDFGNK